LHQRKSKDSKSGWIVFNLDYCGNERCFETAWIDEKTLLTNFTLQ